MFKRLELLLIAVCLFLTVGIVIDGQRKNSIAATAEFERVSDSALTALQSRMNLYLQSLNGAAGMMQTSENTEYDDFETYVQSLSIETYLPGINGIGFIEPVAADRLEEVVNKMRADGVSDFRVHPITDNDVKYIIKYIAPVGPNQQAVGLDISFEKGRRDAAERARETGLPLLTPRILLVQDATKQPGFLLLRPLFQEQGSERGDFLGWVYAPFVGRNLLQGLTPDQHRTFDFQVYDGTVADPETLIYASDEANEHIMGAYLRQYTVEFFGRPWTIHYQSTALFDSLFPGRTPWLFLIAGFLLTGMLAISLRAIRLRGDSMAEIAALRGRQISAREEENRSIVDNGVVGIFILDMDRKILFANNAAFNIFSADNDEMGGLPFSRFVTESTDQTSTAVYNAVGVTMQDAQLYLDIQYNEWDTLNGVRRITAIVRNVTAEVGAVEELAVIKQRYDMALAGSQIGVFELDLTTGTSVTSDTWRKIMKIGPDEEDTQGIFMDRIHPDDLPRLFEADRRCIDGEADRSLTEYRMKFGETWRWMRSDAVITERLDDGTATRMVGTQSDVTALHHSRNALEESEKRFRTVLEAAPVGMAILDRNGNFTSVNASMMELTGYDDAEMLNNFSLARVLPKEDIENIRAAITAMIKSRVHEIYRAEHRVLRKDGGERWGLFNITWTYDKNAGAYVYIAQVNDITDQKKLDQIKSEFVSTVSHELRTPLTSIKGALGLINMSAKDKLPASALRLIEIARTNADRLTDIVNDILDLEKISSGDVEFNVRSIDMRTIVDAAMTEMMPFAVTHQNRLVIEQPAETVYVNADRGRMMQVLANLISNACKYSFENTDVKIKIEEHEDVAIVYIQNTGPGVPDSFKSRIFQAFSQADGSDTRAKGGTGLGLNITRQIIWRQGGEIGFESKPDGPTVFWFTCPLATRVNGPELNDEIIARNMSQRRLKVLHLEDDEDFAEVLRAGLSPFADVTNVTRLNGMREVLDDGPYDVIILDWTVPDGDAADVLEEIGAVQPKARIVGLSSDAARKKDSRVTAHLVKSQTEMAHIIECVTDLAKEAS